MLTAEIEFVAETYVGNRPPGYAFERVLAFPCVRVRVCTGALVYEHVRTYPYATGILAVRALRK